jgi:predicted nucleic acid-binding protein
MAILLDTGILLRAFEFNEPECRSIRRALRTVHVRGERLATTLQNLAEFWNVSTRPTSARGGYGYSAAAAIPRLRFIERSCEILTESSSSHQIWSSLVEELQLTGVTVHDARIAAIMLAQGYSQILTLNAQDFRRFPGVIALVPSEVA